MPDDGLRALMNPRSIAVIGASGNPTKPGGMILRFLELGGYQGDVFPVNPARQDIQGRPCYARVSDLPEPPDVAVVVVSHEHVVPVLHECANLGVPAAVVMTGGFGEGATGSAGRQRRLEIERLQRNTGIRILGPNTVGMVNFGAGAAMTFADWFQRHDGRIDPIAIISQSGSVGGLIFAALQAQGVGAQYWFGTGNEVDIEPADLLTSLTDDPSVRVAVLFIEGVRSGAAFRRSVLRWRAAGKQLVILKAGNSAPAKRASVSHTGKMSSPRQVYAGVLRQAGAVACSSVMEAAYAAQMLLSLDVECGRRVGVVSASGGACSLISDHAIDAGLEVPSLEPRVRQSLADLLPEYGGADNPIDLTADVMHRTDIMRGVLETIGTDDTGIDTWVFFGLPIITRYADEIAAFARSTKRLTLAISGISIDQAIRERLESGGALPFDDTGAAFGALAQVVKANSRSPMLDRKEAVARHTRPESSTTTSIPSRDLKELLRNNHICQPVSLIAPPKPIAPQFLEGRQLRFPVALKVVGDELTHKSDFGGVVLGIRDHEELRRASQEVLAQARRQRITAEIGGLEVQEMISDGVEVLVSITQDADFGAVLALGTGGAQTELRSDVSFRALPVEADDVLEALHETQISYVLKGYRHQKPADVEALVRCVLNLGRLYENSPEIVEVELNPVVVLPRGRGACAVDAIGQWTLSGEPG